MPDITDKQVSDQYRFSGYNLPMLQLDSTGPSYYLIPEPHPYYSHQPAYWQKTDGMSGAGTQSFDSSVVTTVVSPAASVPTTKQTKQTVVSTSQTNNLYPFLNF